MRAFVISLILALTVFSGVAVAQAEEKHDAETDQNSIWFERRVGHVVVGVEEKNGFLSSSLAYGYYLAAIGPRPAEATKDYGSCLKLAVRDAGIAYIEELDNITDLFIDGPLAEPLYADRQVKNTRDSLIAARSRYKNLAVRYCRKSGDYGSLRRYIDGTSLALVKRECPDQFCEGLEVPVPGQGKSEAKRRERAFEAAYYWVLANGLDSDVNEVILLAPAPNGGLDARTVEARPGEIWPETLSAETVQEHFETRVRLVGADARTPLLSPVVAAQIEMPKTTVMRTAQAFSEPLTAHRLGVDAPEWALHAIQDEVARTRLRECRVFRALNDVDEVGKCAGYQVDDTVLMQCLSDGPCLPPVTKTAEAGAILLSGRARLADLAQDALVPRPFSRESFGDLIDTYKACAPAGTARDAVEQCLGEQIVPTKIEPQAKCLLGPGVADRTACLVDDADTQRAIKRLKACHERGARACAIDAALPAELGCVVKAESAADLACLDAGRLGAAAECLNSSPDDLVQRAACFSEGAVPQEVAQLVECYRTSESEALLAACALGAGLPPEQAQLVRCATESGGDPMSAGVCLAAPRLGLTPGQQIILQCVAASGGVPATAAACTVGRFTLQELQGCQRADFGDPGCFGDTNEFQKLAVMLTGDKISRNSVVGQLAVAHIDTANAAVSGTGHVLSELSKGGQNTIEGAGKELEKIRKAPAKALLGAPENIRREAANGLKNVMDNLNPGNWRL